MTVSETHAKHLFIAGLLNEDQKLNSGFLPWYAMNAIREAEKIFGPMASTYRYAGLAFAERGPVLFYDEDGKTAYMLLSAKHAAGSIERLHFQIAFLAPELISGIGPKSRSNLILGACSYFVRYWCGNSDGVVGKPEALVTLIVQKHPEIALRMLQNPTVLKTVLPDKYDFLMAESTLERAA